MFKKGDKVRRIQDEHGGMVVGDVAVVKNDQLPGSPNLELVGYSWVHDSRKFELDNTVKETTSKWLKENAWYIRVESQEHSKLIQEWLFEHGMYWEYSGSNIVHTDSTVITSLQYGGKTNGYLLHSTTTSYCIGKAEELKPQFKLVLEGVTLPEAPKKTEQQLKLEQLEATIQKAQQEIQQLKEMK